VSLKEDSIEDSLTGEVFKREIEKLNNKFEKARKAIIEQANKIAPIENELLGNREEYFTIMKKMEEIENANSLILKTLNTIMVKEKKKSEKTLAFFIKTWYIKFTNFFN